MSAPVAPPRTTTFGRFFLPGPTEVRPEVLEAQVKAMIGHRGTEIRTLVQRLQDGLKVVFRTERPVLISTSSATGLMEAAVRNGVRRRVLSLVNGAFSKRFADIARACGKDVDVLEVPPGRHNDPAELEARLRDERYDAVTVVHSETSTGVLNPLEELAAVTARHEDTLLLVDSVTGVAGAPVHTDAWGLDFVLTGSQKALALPPGLAFAVATERMLERAEACPDRGVYFDLPTFFKNLGSNQTPNTPALSLFYALDRQLTDIRAEGMEARWERHRSMADRCWAWVETMREEKGVPLAFLPERPWASPTVSCIRLPEGTAGSAVAGALKEKGFVIAPGYGKLKDATIRIGHMGDHTVEELDVLLEALEEVVVR